MEFIPQRYPLRNTIRIIIFSLFLTCSPINLAHSQFQNGAGARTGNGFSSNGNAIPMFASMRNKKNIVTSDLPTIGSVFLNDLFLPCTIYYKEEFIGNFYYRHNAYNDEIEIKDTNLKEEIENSLSTLKELKLIDNKNKKELSLKAYKNKDNQIRNGYLYLLQKNKNYNLFFKANVKYTEGTKPVNSMVRATPNKFSFFNEYYFSQSDDNLTYYIPSKKNNFLKLFEKKGKEKIKEFIKEQKINLKKESDLIKVFDFLNTI